MARRAFFTSVWMASNVFCVISGRRSRMRATDSTIDFVLEACPLWPMQRWSVSGTRTRSMVAGAAPSPRVNRTQPPSDATAASMPDGLP